MERPRSPVSSGVSMKSDWSKEHPPDFSWEQRSFRSADSGYAPSVSSSSASSVGVLCDVCPHTAVKNCADCMSSYCETHVRDHYTSPDLQRHQLQDIQCKNLCEHHHKKLKLYCRTDQSAICWRCLLYDHRNHDVIEQNPGETSSKSSTRRDVPPPGLIEFTAVKSDSVSLRWSPPEGADGPHRYMVTWRGGGKQCSLTVTDSSLKVIELIPGEKYHFTVATLTEDDHQSTWVERSVITEVPSPENLTVDLDLRSLKACLKWTKATGVDQVSYLLEIFRDQEQIDTIHAHSPSYTITDLQYGDYTIRVSNVLGNGRQSKPTSQTFKREELRIVLMGKCGSGISASGNTILGREEFEAKASHMPVTLQCKMARGVVDGRRLCVIDTPGLIDKEFSVNYTVVEAKRGISLAFPGPHVVLVVVSLLNIYFRQVTEIIQKTFGKDISKHTIVLFTHSDHLRNKTIEEFLSGSKELSDFVSQCGGRYHVFNNKDAENHSQVTELLQKIDEMMEKNGGGYYTPEML